MALFAKEWESLSKSKEARCFVVVHRNALRLRSSASSGDADCTGKYLRPGQCFVATATVEKEDATYLKLADGSGWVFDRIEGQKTALELDALELGEWWYTITSQDFVEVRTAPSASEECRSGWIMCPKEVTVVGLRCKVGEHLYLQLQDGRGWLFEKQPASVATKKSTHLSQDVMRECTAQQCEELADAKKIAIDTTEGEHNTKSAFALEKIPTTTTNDPREEEEEEDLSRKRGGGMCFGLCGRNPAVAP